MTDIELLPENVVKIVSIHSGRVGIVSIVYYNNCIDI